MNFIPFTMITHYLMSIIYLAKKQIMMKKQRARKTMYYAIIFSEVGAFVITIFNLIGTILIFLPPVYFVQLDPDDYYYNYRRYLSR